MQIGIITLFPEMFEALSLGVVGRAFKTERLSLHLWQLRDFTEDVHHTVDDRPYGGGPGMVMKIEPLERALAAAKQKLGPGAKVIYPSPQGRCFHSDAARAMAREEKLIFIAGRYEGIDERFLEAQVDEEWSLGDYVLTGGELATCVMIDAFARFLPGVLGDAESSERDSFSAGLLDCPHYTRPEVHAGRQVPEVLLSGDHQAIARWREKQALGRTWQRRPELLQKLLLTEQQQKWLDEFKSEQGE